MGIAFPDLRHPLPRSTTATLGVWLKLLPWQDVASHAGFIPWVPLEEMEGHLPKPCLGPAILKSKCRVVQRFQIDLSLKTFYKSCFRSNPEHKESVEHARPRILKDEKGGSAPSAS